MKRGTPQHPKTLRLASLLGVETWGAVGVLESIWHFAQRYCPRGDLGRFDDSAIARGIEWSGDASRMVVSLVSARFVDRCLCHRLRIHDWPDHADAGIHNSKIVKTSGFLECYESLPDDTEMIGESYGDHLATATATATAVVVRTEGVQGEPKRPRLLAPRKRSLIVSEEATVVATAFMKTFNAVHNRRLGLLRPVTHMVDRRLSEGIEAWLIVAMPICEEARDPSFDPRPEWLLRDGKHKHTGPDGRTSGDTDWIGRVEGELDRLVLTERLAFIAKEIGVLDSLMARGVSVRSEEEF